ncbi:MULTISPECIES: hypothetical protein [Fusobacterium]|uniref:hypothetical protein n=1 Tax=Fusobacterium TaxID=848 RepID=UPI001F44D6E2|nr:MULTISPECIES: hypothetical protein [Fusobacterium]MCF2612824.1 hypothetical protein [Fusobacterium perfoetens]MDY2981502.1 hypothetical protein [Fusobacterium sp.]
MSKTYLFVRETGISGTKIVETTRKEAIQYIKKNRGTAGKQIGILGGNDYNTVKSVYGEYAPFEKISDISKL